MNNWKASRALTAITAFATLFAGTASWAAATDCSGTKRSKASPYTEVIRPGDRPDHEMIQAIRIHEISSKDADFDASEQTVYAHQDAYGGSGTSVGYFLYTLKSGEKIWARFDSIYSTKPARGSWETTYHGVFQFVGGTGKYVNVRGGGHYQGTVTPASGFDETFVCSVEF
jgi:hypothetical protein